MKNIKSKELDVKTVRLPQKMEGFLLKKSPSWFKNWQDRYFVLENRKLKYYKGKDVEVPQGVINFDHLDCEVVKVSDDRFNIQVPNRVFEFKAESSQLGAQWVEEMKRHIE